MGRSSAPESKASGTCDSWKGKLLLVDEDLGELQLYTAVLTQLGYEVQAMACFGEAAECVGREVFDLVLVSQGSSYFEGRCVLARAMEKDRGIPVLVLTRSVEVPCYAEAIQLGARDYLQKPLPTWELERLVTRYLRSRTGSA